MPKINPIAAAHDVYDFIDSRRNADKLETELLREVEKLISVDGIPQEAYKCFKKLVKKLNLQYKSFHFEDLAIRRLKHFNSFALHVAQTIDNGYILSNDTKIWKVAANIVNTEKISRSELQDQQRLLILLSETIYYLKVYINLRETKTSFKEICVILNKPTPFTWEANSCSNNRYEGEPAILMNEMKTYIIRLNIPHQYTEKNEDKLVAQLLKEAQKFFSASKVPKEVTKCFDDILKQLWVEYDLVDIDNERNFKLKSICLRRMQNFKRHMMDVELAKENGVFVDNTELLPLAAHIVNLKPINKGDHLTQHKLMVLFSEIVYRLYMYTRVLSVARLTSNKRNNDLKLFCELLETK